MSWPLAVVVIKVSSQAAACDTHGAKNTRKGDPLGSKNLVRLWKIEHKKKFLKKVAVPKKFNRDPWIRSARGLNPLNPAIKFPF